MAVLAAGAVHSAGAQSLLPPRAPVTQTEMSFDFSDGVVRLDVDLGESHPAKLILDTGNPSSTIDLDAAHALGLTMEEKSKRQVGSGPGALAYYPLAIAHVRLGSETFNDCVFVAAPLAKTILDDYGYTCDGTLGYGLFKNRVVQIDFPARKFRLLGSAPASTSAVPATPIFWVPFQKGTPPLVTVNSLQIGTHPISAQVDTFFSGSIIFFPAKIPGLNLPPAADVPSVYFEEAKLPAARLREAASLGKATYPPGNPVYVAGKDAHTPQTEIAAVIGTAFLRESVLTLDFQHDQVFVSASHEGAQSAFPLKPGVGPDAVLDPPAGRP